MLEKKPGLGFLPQSGTLVFSFSSISVALFDPNQTLLYSLPCVLYYVLSSLFVFLVLRSFLFLFFFTIVLYQHMYYLIQRFFDTSILIVFLRLGFPTAVCSYYLYTLNLNKHVFTYLVHLFAYYKIKSQISIHKTYRNIFLALSSEHDDTPIQNRDV